MKFTMFRDFMKSIYKLRNVKTREEKMSRHRDGQRKNGHCLKVEQI